MGNMPATSTHLDLLHGHPSAPISSAEGLATCQTAQTAAPSSGAQVNITIVTCNPTSGSQFFICSALSFQTPLIGQVGSQKLQYTAATADNDI
ncbi:hypothetical protein VDGL01_10061 [Verticillium dahliae]